MERTEGDLLESTSDLTEKDPSELVSKISTASNLEDQSSTLDFPVHVHEEEDEEPVEETESSQPTKKRRRPGKRRIVQIDDTPPELGLKLPPNQYETVIERRAVRKLELSDPKPENNLDEDGNEIYGDISVGMKLQVLAGKVIVQHLNPLNDGRASPAQLSGMIKRGDVLIAVDGQGIVNLALDQLMIALKPLSTANEDGSYARSLALRFSVGTGLDLLLKCERKQANGSSNSAKTDDVAAGVMNLFPMVDQLSGMPLFEEEEHVAAPMTPQPGSPVKDDETEADIDDATIAAAKVKEKDTRPLTSFIADIVSSDRIEDRKGFISEYFMWNEKSPAFLNAEETLHGNDESYMTVPEFYERGRRALLGAGAVTKFMERIDSGRDIRSFQTWSSTLSLYSRASTRRKYILDSSSLPVNIKVVEEESGSADISLGSDEEEEDADELLVHLAAKDDIWRKQMLEYLRNNLFRETMDDVEEGDENEDDANVDSVLSNELGQFLFGDKMTKILKNRKRPKILPPEDATAVLFDLVTKISTTVPDEITAAGTHVSYRSSLVPFKGVKRKQSGDGSTTLALHFLLEEALPQWLKTFRPLEWSHRRILWPPERLESAKSTASTMSADSLTLESESVMSFLSPMSSRRHGRQKDLREKIEEQELDPQTRSETCFLVTYYFTQKLLPKLAPDNYENDEKLQQSEERASNFVNDYGSYLKLHTCIAYAAILEARNIILVLLDVAKFDPRHKDAMRSIAKGSNLMFYEPPMLSALLTNLHSMNDLSDSVKQNVISLCSASFPDVRPWQVRESYAKFSKKNKPYDFRGDFYYEYLSHLLDATDGHDRARQNLELVKEWCTISLKDPGDKGEYERRLRNFYRVASIASSDHLAYRRDLLFLMKASLDAKEYSLALDLASEAIDSNDHKCSSEEILEFLRQCCTLFLPNKSRKLRIDDSHKYLRRTMRLFMRLSKRFKGLKTFDLAREFARLHADYVKSTSGQSGRNEYMTILMDEIPPAAVLSTLQLTVDDKVDSKDLSKTLKELLKQGATKSRDEDLSSALFRLQNIQGTFSSVESEVPAVREVKLSGTWKKLAQGELPIIK